MPNYVTFPYEGEALELHDLIPRMIGDMINKDIRDLKEFKKSDETSPYKFLATIIGVKERAVRSWCVSWETSSGNRIPINHFIVLLKVSRTQRFTNWLALVGLADNKAIKKVVKLLYELEETIKKEADGFVEKAEKVRKKLTNEMNKI